MGHNLWIPTFMTALEVRDDGNIIKSKLQQKGAKLTDDDLHFVKSTQEELLSRLQ